MKFVWPPITVALDERADKIREGLSAADTAKAELATANKRVEQELSAARTDATQRLADAERLAQSMVEEAKGARQRRGREDRRRREGRGRAGIDQGARGAARAGRGARGPGAEQILRREVDAARARRPLVQLKVEL